MVVEILTFLNMVKENVCFSFTILEQQIYTKLSTAKIISRKIVKFSRQVSIPVTLIKYDITVTIYIKTGTDSSLTTRRCKCTPKMSIFSVPSLKPEI